MFYACLATAFCLALGIMGITLAMIDIERYNFGLYLALLSVVGTTVSIAFWIISPTMCADPRCVKWLLDKYGYKFDPIREAVRTYCLRNRRRFWDDDEEAGNKLARLSPRGAGRAIRKQRSRERKPGSTPRPSLSSVPPRKLSHSRSMPDPPTTINTS